MSSQKTTRPYTLRKRADAMAATRERITEAAMDLHGSVGPSRTTITAVAERAGVQRQTVYRHFATDADLFAACSGHFAALHPVPSRDAWRAIADPGQRLARALDELYAFYEDTAAMWANIFRDEPLVPAIGPNLARFRGFLDDAARALADGWTATDRAVLLAATRHAVEFHTWQSLSGIPRADAIELASAIVHGAATRGVPVDG
jgi:AcrR family transcriptional regulator